MHFGADNAITGVIILYYLNLYLIISILDTGYLNQTEATTFGVQCSTTLKQSTQSKSNGDIHQRE